MRQKSYSYLFDIIKDIVQNTNTIYIYRLSYESMNNRIKIVHWEVLYTQCLLFQQNVTTLIKYFSNFSNYSLYKYNYDCTIGLSQLS